MYRIDEPSPIDGINSDDKSAGAAQDLFGRGIHTALICPGFTDTEMVRPIYDESEAFRSFIAGKVSSGRLISGEEMAEVVYRAACMPVFNGAVLHANAGQRMT